VIHTSDAGLVGLAFVTAAGLIVYGALLAIAFRAGAGGPSATSDGLGTIGFSRLPRWPGASCSGQ